MPVIVSLAVALVAVAIAIGSWFRPTPTAPTPIGSPPYSDQQTAAAKTTMCGVYDKIYAALTKAGSETSDDPNRQFINAINIRLAIHVNSDYIRQMLAENPATPQNIVDGFHAMTSAYDEIVLAQIAGAQKDELAPFNEKLDAADAKVSEACK